MIATAPGASARRRRQTLREIGVAHTGTIVAMLPVELPHAGGTLARLPDTPAD